MPAEPWPWLALAGLGFFHGINPAMGWLFAVALGLHRQSRGVVMMAWAPIALGHATSLVVVLVAVLGLGLALDHETLGQSAGAILVGWAVWHGLRGHRQRLRIGMRTGFAGLSLWSFVMSSAHGAGLMLIPVLLPLCLSASPPGKVTISGSIPIAAAALTVHTVAMLATIIAISVIVYEWVGLALLRWGWINFDLIWTAALGGCGALLIFA
jgi:hypothetical protein